MTLTPHSEHVRVEATLQSLARVREALEATLDRVDWPADDESRLMLAAGEAVCNAIEHGSVPAGHVDVAIDTDAGGLTLVVTDEGDPGRPARIDAHAAAPPHSSVRGRGIMIMRELADTLRIEPSGRGVRVTMRFERAAGGVHAARPRVA
ncbi:MAG: ATP-binding protein [Thermoleophilia bacterium]|nr:ATP-binding protein [Thermoleophilia bacterium]